MAPSRIDPAFAPRYLNEGFSGGEKKRLEILQMAMLGPTIAILDETDSGLDIDALRRRRGHQPTLPREMGVSSSPTTSACSNYIEPQFVHVLIDGRVVRSGGQELSHELEANGYDWVRQQVGLPGRRRRRGRRARAGRQH